MGPSSTADWGAGGLTGQAVAEVRDEVLDRYPLLGHRVALAHGDGLVVERLEVDGDTQGGSDLVVATVAPTDGAGLVVVDLEGGAQAVGHLPGHGREALVLGQRQH